ncbi:MAG: N-acetylneuraminate synthase [Bacteroidia bacterium]|nr:N-acetylneuraminate synthase [Bacteroidia bacterium]
MSQLHTIIIAEAGVNHNGDLNLAKKLIDAASEAKADYVKFQSFIAQDNISSHAVKADYQIENTRDEVESQLDMVRKLELSAEDHQILFNYCQEKNIKFLSTAFDSKSIELLKEYNLDFFKIPSGELTNLPYLENAASLGLPIIMSTGMATLNEVKEALHILQQNGANKDNITLLHCNTEYPTPMSDVNLLAMQTLANEFNVKVGYSDHTLGIEIPIAAVALGAVCIEKHFTLDRNLEGPDHQASLEPDELVAMVSAIRNIEKAMGDGIKKPSESEHKNISIARKSIFTRESLPHGHKLSAHDLIMKRPGDGISPMKINEVIGKTLTSNVPQETKLSWELLK